MAELQYLSFFLIAFSSLFTIINPISTTSIFLTITKGNTRAEKLHIARKATLTALLVLITFAFAGTFILKFFSITLDAFKIAGGLLVTIIGFQMIHTKKRHFRTEEEELEAIEKEDTSIIPIAIPMLSGPGAMTTTIVLMNDAGNSFLFQILVILSIFLVCLIAYILFSNAKFFEKYINESAKNVIDKIMGLIVLVIGVQFIINGVTGVITPMLGLA